MRLSVCPDCYQNYLRTEAECPYCSKSRSVRSGLPLGILLGVGLVSCIPAKDLYGVEVVEQDMDEDGFPEEIDCHDQDSSTYPGAAPQDSADACMTDGDGDGYGDDSPEPDDMGIAAGTDCDDSDPSVYPGAEEVAGDNKDSNCNGSDDD